MKVKKIIISAALTLAVLAGVCSASFAAGTKMGDVDFDGKVTAEDALLVLRATADTNELTAEQVKAADATYDGKINSVDALRILLYVSGRITTLDKLGGDEGDNIII